MLAYMPNRLLFANQLSMSKVADLLASQTVFERDMHDVLAQKSAAGHTRLMGWLFGDVSDTPPLKAFRKHAEQCREEDLKKSEDLEHVAVRADEAHVDVADDHAVHSPVIVDIEPSMQPTPDVIARLIQPLQHKPSLAMVRLITHHYHLFLDQYMLRHVLVHHAGLLTDVPELSRAQAWAHTSEAEAFSAFWADFYVAWRAMHPKGMAYEDDASLSGMKRAFAAEAQRASDHLDDMIARNPNLVPDFVRGMQDRAVVQPVLQPAPCPKPAPGDAKPDVSSEVGAPQQQPVPSRLAQQNQTQHMQQTEYYTVFNMQSVPRPQPGQGG